MIYSYSSGVLLPPLRLSTCEGNTCEGKTWEGNCSIVE